MLRTALLVLAGLVLVVGLAFGGFLMWTLRDLPSTAQLLNYEPKVTSRVHAGDGALIAELPARGKDSEGKDQEYYRVYVPIDAIPERVRLAFVAAEDGNFFDHSGVDFGGVMRAVFANIGNAMQGRRLEGGSTITQQVAKNMLLGDEQTLTRKIKEAFLAWRIETAFKAENGRRDGKGRILELYLNEIFLGNNAYGVAAASLNYFNKSLDQLTLGEAAFLAALPKAPSTYNLDTEQGRARAAERRDYVLDRMVAEGHVTEEEAAAARREQLTQARRFDGPQYVGSTHFVTEVRKRAVEELGEEALTQGGLTIRSTINVNLQLAAVRALRKSLEDYDRRKGWRGPVATIDPAPSTLAQQLRQTPREPALTGWRRAVVTAAGRDGVTIRLENGTEGRLAAADVTWAAQGARREASRALTPGAVVYVAEAAEGRWALRQTPEVQGALVAMDPHNGRVLAMVGGYDLRAGDLNRATQSLRQPGSAFKPIVYAAALEFRLTPATLIEDAPFAIAAGDGTVWSPENYTREFYGPSTMRRGFEMSRNAMTVRMAYEMGMDKVVDLGQRLGVYDRLDPVLSMALGAGETTPLRLTTAYASFVNGGRRVSPVFIDRIQNGAGATVYPATQPVCPNCRAEWTGQAPPTLPDARQEVLNPIIAYQIVSMAEGVVQRGTGTSIRAVGAPLGGKTGTTNDYRDAWFVGFSPDLVVGVWVGFDRPRNMGEGESGGRLAAPVFRDFMADALRLNESDPIGVTSAELRRRPVRAVPFRQPPGVRLVRIDAKTGLLPVDGVTTDTILEVFEAGTEPNAETGATAIVFGAGDISAAELGDLFPTDNTPNPTPEGDGQGPQAAPPPRQTEELDGIY